MRWISADKGAALATIAAVVVHVVAVDASRGRAEGSKRFVSHVLLVESAQIGPEASYVQIQFIRSNFSATHTVARTGRDEEKSRKQVCDFLFSSPIVITCAIMRASLSF